MKRIRISTLMLLIAIVAMGVALVVERRRSEARLLRVEQDRARLTREVLLLQTEFASVYRQQRQAAEQAAIAAKAAADAKPAAPPSR